MDDTFWMHEALKEAKFAFEEGEVPVGAVIVKNNRIIGRGHNRVEALKDPTAHAEILAITSAANTLGDWRLNDCTIYVTLEPCPMCAGAIWVARISRCVFGAYDTRIGGIVSKFKCCEGIEIKGGVLEREAVELLQSFFEKLRDTAD